MADVKAAREEVQKVVAFLVNRFGSQEDVFRHLTLALANLQDDPEPREPETEPAAGEFVEKTILVEVSGETGTTTVSSDAEAVFVPSVQPEPEPRRKRRRSRKT